MSRAERRQYERMKKSQDPFAPRQMGGAGRPPKPRRAGKPRDLSFSGRFWIRTALGAAVVGIIGLSVAWSQGPQLAAMAGGGAAGAFVLVVIGLRLVMRRAAAR